MLESSPVPSPFETTNALRARTVAAVIAQMGFNHPGLNDELRRRLGGSDPEGGALVVDPVIEAAAAYEHDDRTLGDLSGNLLSPDIVGALTGGSEDYRFDVAMNPYRHQLESWHHLLSPDPRSVLVTSGTGSGKTECFLVPLLDDLIREAQLADARLTGVRAIMLYPLNALIASQQERLRKWTAPLKGRVRFGLYNGLTPEALSQHEQWSEGDKYPGQVFDRKTIRNDPPPILVTNVTMLEYLTIRREDRPLIQNSLGKLRWIIIDEAHSYVGSAAAEIALLLRRVLNAFGVAAKDVRFVATSATIGSPGPETSAALRRFLADLAGVGEDQVHVVEGKRTPTKLPDPSTGGADLAGNATVQRFIRELERTPLSMAAVRANLKGMDAISTLEAIADDREKTPLLQLRVHQFMRAVPGLWSCLNPSCGGPKPSDWPYGALAFEKANRCGDCSSPVFEVIGCRDCGEPFLSALDKDGMLSPQDCAPDRDEFAAVSETESQADEDDAAPDSGPGRRRLMAVRSVHATREVAVDPKTGSMPDRREAGTPLPLTSLDWDGTCPSCCAMGRGADDSTLRPFRFGAPFLIGNAAPVVLEGVRPMNQAEGLLPAEGRQVLSFTDSRQGTARFAANIETNSERGYTRGYVYHLVQKSGFAADQADPELIELRRTVTELEKVAESRPALKDLARVERRKLDEMEKGSRAGVPWKDARRLLAQDPIAQHWMRSVWQDRDPRFASNAEDFANFLLLRELARRPRRANSLETLGLSQLRFEHIDRLDDRSVPEPLRQRKFTAEDWRDFLYVLIDTPVRQSFALNVSWDDVRWLLPRGGVRRSMVGPGEAKRSSNDLVWPQSRPAGPKSNAVLALENALAVDSALGEGRALVNDVLAQAWRALRPLFESSGSEYALNLDSASLAPVTSGYLCPVTRRILTHKVFGRTPYGHRENSPLAKITPREIKLPVLPLAYPRSLSEREQLKSWLVQDSIVGELRVQGIWNNLHDRAAFLAPFIRAEEHSAQQPPARLRAFETEFKAGKINMLACSTTMEMGVDIGAVSAVVMTNVPPSIANYRQRIGRAGRRRQGFATSLTLARDTPLDRETFRHPDLYLRRELRAPRVELSAPRIVQRHVNALLLAQWFAEAKGELLKIKCGAFFGFPQNPTDALPGSAPVGEFCAWIDKPSVRARVAPALQALTRGTALEDDAEVWRAAIQMFSKAAEDFGLQWRALRDESLATTDAAKASISIQMKRLCRENLLKELANRGLLPGHGFPTSVVPFINDSRGSAARADDEREGAFGRRYNYPSRNCDIAIREYAPGAEVVLDGLVWRSAGVTLNWQRPAHLEDVKEIQSLRYYWQCAACGAADCDLLRVQECPVCGSKELESRRFLEPAGFRVDWNEQSHADTDKVDFIEPEQPRISARDTDWEPLLDPVLGRARTSHKGLVFYASAGVRRKGYRICLECGRAEEEPPDGSNPLAEHKPLRGASRDGGIYCPGGGRPFAVTSPISLGHAVTTDVAEMQPEALTPIGGAWALVSALREALARQLGIQPGELGMAVEPRRNALAHSTHSVFLFDRSSGGAGFSTRLLEDVPGVLDEARKILDCKAEGCVRGCAACVLTADLFDQQEIVDRKAALACVDAMLHGMRTPQPDDIAIPGARLSDPVSDALLRKAKRGDRVTIFAPDTINLSALADDPFATLFAQAHRRGVTVRVVLQPASIKELDSAQRLGLRDASIRHNFALASGEPITVENGAKLLALLEAGGPAEAWMTRDRAAFEFARTWGVGQESPVVFGTLASPPTVDVVGDEALLPRPNAAVRVLEADQGRPLKSFGSWFAKEIESQLAPLDLWRPGQLSSISYSDRYLRSPLNAVIALRAFAALRDALQGKDRLLHLTVHSTMGELSGRGPYLLHHDWRRPEDRGETIEALAQGRHFQLALRWECPEHARELDLVYRTGEIARIYLDQGFGYWRIGSDLRHDFIAAPRRQAQALDAINPTIVGRGSSYLAVVRSNGPVSGDTSDRDG